MTEPAGETVDPYNAPETAGETTCPYNGGSKVSLRLGHARVLTTAPGLSFIALAPLRYTALRCGRTQFSPTSTNLLLASEPLCSPSTPTDTSLSATHPLLLCAIVYKCRGYFIIDIDLKVLYNIFSIIVVLCVRVPRGLHSMLTNTLFYDIGYLKT